MSGRFKQLGPEVRQFVKGKTSANYKIESELEPGCINKFYSRYQCGFAPTSFKVIRLDNAHIGDFVNYDCPPTNCPIFRLTLGDDGNLVLTNSENKQLWTSNTNKTGISLDKYSAKAGKYGRNYLLSGEMLNIGEFIGSPSGNCYLIMDKGPDGNGLQLNYSVFNCDENNIGNNDTANGLYSLSKTAYNELIGSINKIKPEYANLSKVVPVEDKLEQNKTTQLKEDVNDYMGFRHVLPIVRKHNFQLSAMDEDTGLYLTRYKYRRIMWLAITILVIFGAIKVARKSI
jgi:hypothetical protein